ncbi:unnamed protein product [Calypogeia fissa]
MAIERRFGPLLFILIAQFMATSTLAARSFQAHEGGRVLLQAMTSSHGNLLTDYIGASGDSTIQFTDVPIDANVQYIFPLSFAIDADVDGNTQNGVFSPYWETSLTPASAQSFLQANSNVRLGLSIAGASQYIDAQTTRTVAWYDPPDTNVWISNAVNSITSLAQQYSLTVIDIDYETFPVNGTFTECIGGLITQLKNNGTITVASIAPFGNTLSIYQDLFTIYGSVIDYVNYQFYADGLTSPSDYVTRFNTVVASFDIAKMMASVEALGRGLQGSDFISAAQQVPIAGIMIWDVDDSKRSNFSTENAATAYLQMPNSHGNLLTDYIGSSGNDSIQFTDVPIVATVQYIFPLSFAIDADVNGTTQNGVFSPFWESSLTPGAAQSFVQAHSNVRLSVSLAGSSQYIDAQTRRSVDWYDPPDTNAWISNAVTSITSLVQQYSLRGIDIAYDSFPENATFTECIGGLITQLKGNGTISVVSIAPFGNTLSVYQDLFANYGSKIDYVNYQFYVDGLTTPSEYVMRFKMVAASLDPTKMMASVEAGGRGLQGSDFISAVRQVSIAGIMIWDVDDSERSSFATENVATAYLSS